MTKRNIYIAGVALVVAGTAGVAGWMSASVDGRAPEAVATVGTLPAGVAETEGVVTAPVAASVEPGPQVEPAYLAPPPGAPAREVATPRARTPIAAPVPARRDEPVTAPAPREESTAVEPRTTTASSTPVEAAQSEPRVEYVELVVPIGTVLGIRLNTAVSSENAEVEDRVEGTVTRDVIANGHIAIPAGTRVLGSVNDVTRGGKFKERARLGIRFHTLVLADGTRESMKVDAVVREGDSPTRESAAKVGIGAAGGAIVGGIMGGKKGAILGGAAGAGAGAAAVIAGDRSVAAIASGTPLSIRLDAPVKVTIERN